MNKNQNEAVQPSADRPKTMRIILSVVIAFFVWMAAMLAAPEITKHIKDVPISVDIPTSAMLEVIEGEDTKVSLILDGKQFEILKFRSMRVDAEKDGVARLSTGDKDDRITKVGHIIRACRLDELPQLLNILKGDLSVVGPRPERPEIAAQYCEEMPEFALRLQAKAGLTGYAQVYGKYNTTPYDKLQMDLMYIAHPSLIEDLKIMLATVKILFMPESTEGVSEGQTTAMSGENR